MSDSETIDREIRVYDCLGGRLVDPVLYDRSRPVSTAGDRNMKNRDGDDRPARTSDADDDV